MDGRARDRRRGARAEGGGGRRQDVRRADRADEGRAARAASASSTRSTRATSLGVLGDYVTLEAGTGAVHTAPGHGADDFNTGMSYGLEIYAPIGPGGHFLDTVELFGGQRVFDANPNVEEALKERGRLWHREAFSHQYPALLALPQPGDLPGDVAVVHRDRTAIRGWPAASRGQSTLREAALDAIDHDVQWIPSWGHDRMYNMVANRPDWCISRQRVWGVPIPAVDCTKCGEAIITPALVEKTAAVFEQYGADAWYERPTEEFIPTGLTCPTCGGTAFEREMNILDVWFDSGSSHEAVLSVRPELDVAGRHLSRRQRPASRLVPELAPGRPRHARPAAVPADRSRNGFLDRRRRQEDVEVGRQHDRAAGRDQGERRRHHPAVGGDERLPRGDPASARRSSRASPRRTASCATRCATCSRTCTTSIRRSTWCRSRSWKRSTATSSRATARSARTHPARLRGLRLRADLPGADAVRDGGPERASTTTSRRIGSTRWRRARASGARRRRRCT